MKYLRILILVLMSILLPVRGAVAATMLCPEGEGTSTVAVVDEQGHHDVHEDHSVAHHHASEGALNDDSSPGEQPTTCHFCASGCCMASIVGSVPSLAEPGLSSLVTFPEFTVRIPAFQSDGQDRPPRTI